MARSDEKDHNLLKDAYEKQVADIKKKRMIPSGTDSGRNNRHVHEIKLCWKREHPRWSKGLEAFAKDISECRERLICLHSLLDCSSRMLRN